MTENVDAIIRRMNREALVKAILDEHDWLLIGSERDRWLIAQRIIKGLDLHDALEERQG